MPIELSVHQVRPGVAIVSIEGALTLGTSLHAADTNLQKVITTGSPQVVLDLKNVPFIDSAGLGTLVFASGFAETHNGALRLCQVTERVAALLKLTRTDTILHVDADVERSLAALNELTPEA